MHALKQTVVFTSQLLGILACQLEDENQHVEAENLVTVAERQIVREHDIYPIATDLYLGVGSTRPEMVNRTVFEELAFKAAMSEMMNMVASVISGRGGIQIVAIRRPQRRE